jgi:hypothetical protein
MYKLQSAVCDRRITRDSATLIERRYSKFFSNLLDAKLPSVFRPLVLGILLKIVVDYFCVTFGVAALPIEGIPILQRR